ncbi:DUF4147 domain-containing protein [Candidatus Bipolaricaulota bacterium]|nr:DUF4147 domain-containing protein [Candidatus Bipolaricaulota bacterium]
MNSALVIDRARLRNAEVRHPILTLLEAGLLAVRPEQAVDRCVQRDGDVLRIVDRGGTLCVERRLASRRGRVFVIGAGKASVRMAAQLEAILGDHLAGGAVVAPREDQSRGQRRLRRIRLLAGDHPLPKGSSVAAGRALLQFAHSLGRNDFVLCCFSGGASSLIAVPVPGLDPDDLQAVGSALLGSGVPVGPMNIVRRHLSAVHGGRLAEALLPASFVTLLLSDVAGDLPEIIASGPTVADPSTYAQALDVVDRYSVRDRLPRSAVRVLEQGVAGIIRETVKPGAPAFRGNPVLLAAGGGDAVSAMIAAARQVGIRPIGLRKPLCGDADTLGERLGRLAPRLAARSRLLLAHGETTVIVRGSGMGGRNQQTAAAAALRLRLLGRGDTCVASFATDGVDGVTPAAGALVDAETAGLTRAGSGALSLEQALVDNNCYQALRASRDLLFTGPTGTNVADLFIAGAIEGG